MINYDNPVQLAFGHWSVPIIGSLITAQHLNLQVTICAHLVMVNGAHLTKFRLPLLLMSSLVASFNGEPFNETFTETRMSFVQVLRDPNLPPWVAMTFSGFPMKTHALTVCNIRVRWFVASIIVRPLLHGLPHHF